MAADEIEIVDDIGDGSGNTSLFGDDPSSLGLDTDNPDALGAISAYDAAAADASASIDAQQAAASFGFTWAFDELANDFIKSGSSPIRMTELDCFAEWVSSVISTQRRSCLAVSENIGIDFEKVITKEVGSDVMSIYLEREIREAISIHSRFQDMTDFECSQTDENVTVTFNVITDAGEVFITGDIGGQ
jgi:hypothetical protein